jgi:hypothetical protein
MPLGTNDAIAVALTVPTWSVQEWFIHGHFLHTSESWYGSDIHKWHHELPYLHVSLDGSRLATVWFLAVGAIAVGAGRITGALPTCLTVLATYTFCGGFYEMVHYLAHTSIPLPSYFELLRKRHTLHHMVSNKNWLAFTMPPVDTLFGTDPRAGFWFKSSRLMLN